MEKKDITIEKLNFRIEELEMKAEGKCAECKQVVRGWKPVFGFFAPEWWATMRERGINPANGHLASCNQQNQKQ